MAYPIQDIINRLTGLYGRPLTPEELAHINAFPEQFTEDFFASARGPANPHVENAKLTNPMAAQVFAGVPVGSEEYNQLALQLFASENLRQQMYPDEGSWWTNLRDSATDLVTDPLSWVAGPTYYSTKFAAENPAETAAVLAAAATMGGSTAAQGTTAGAAGGATAAETAAINAGGGSVAGGGYAAPLTLGETGAAAITPTNALASAGMTGADLATAGVTGGAIGAGTAAGAAGGVVGGSGMGAGTAALISGGLGAGASIYAGKQAADAAESAAETQARALEAAGKTQEAADLRNLAFQTRMYEEGVARQQPWLEAGQNALTRLSGLPTFQGDVQNVPFEYADFDPSQIRLEDDPGYNFRLAEGQKQLERALAGMGGGSASGRGMKEAMRWGQGFASQEYGNAYNRALQENQLNYGRGWEQNQMQYGRGVDQYNRNLMNYQQQANQLASLAGVGQTSVGQLQSLGTQQAQTVGNIYSQGAQNQANMLMNQGTNAANAQIAAANARSGMVQGVGQAAIGGLNLYNQMQQNNLLQQYLSGRG